MLTRTRKIYVGAVVIYLLIIAGQVAYAIYDNPPPFKDNTYAFDYLFDTVQPLGVDETMIGAIAIFLFVPIIGAALAIYIKNNHELYNVVGRTGWKKFFARNISYTFLGGVGLYWLGCLLEGLIISIFYHGFVYMPYNEIILIRGDNYLSLNNLANLLIKITLFGIGWGIYAVFIFSVALFVKKNSLCLFLGPVVGFIITLTGNISSDIGGTLFIVSNIWNTTNIINPLENATVENPSPAIYYLNYATTAVFYITLTAVLLRIWYMKNVEKG